MMYVYIVQCVWVWKGRGGLVAYTGCLQLTPPTFPGLEPGFWSRTLDRKQRPKRDPTTRILFNPAMLGLEWLTGCQLLPWPVAGRDLESKGDIVEDWLFRAFADIITSSWSNLWSSVVTIRRCRSASSYIAPPTASRNQEALSLPPTAYLSFVQQQ